MNCKNTR